MVSTRFTKLRCRLAPFRDELPISDIREQRTAKTERRAAERDVARGSIFDVQTHVETLRCYSYGTREVWMEREGGMGI